jgi:cytochrome P450
MTNLDDRIDEPQAAGATGLPGVPVWPEDWDQLPTDELISDFHIFQPALCDVEARNSVLSRLRRECPVGHSDVFGGHWLITRYADQQRAFKNADVFTSKIIILPPLEARDSFISVPIMMDGEEHREFRAVLLGAFTRRRVAGLEPELRQYTRELAEEFTATQGRYDFLGNFASRVPAFGFVRIMALPAEDLDQLLDFKDWLVQNQFSQDEAVRERFQTVEAPQFVAYVQKHVTAREDPATAPDDLLTKIVHSEVFGRRVELDEIARMVGTLIGGGLDTTRASMAMHMEWFARHPARWQELIEHPDRIPTAIEEMLRCHAIASPARLVATDTEIGGHTIRAGELVQMPPAAANFDPEANADPERVDFERDSVRHNTFAAGPHFCLGAGLARFTLEIAYQELTKAVPRFRIAEGTAPRHHAGNVMGMESLELEVVR